MRSLKNETMKDISTRRITKHEPRHPQRPRAILGRGVGESKKCFLLPTPLIHPWVSKDGTERKRQDGATPNVNTKKKEQKSVVCV
jgi:hypothetical protein